jgi:hypothetical protein
MNNDEFDIDVTAWDDNIQEPQSVRYSMIEIPRSAFEVRGSNYLTDEVMIQAEFMLRYYALHTGLQDQDIRQRVVDFGSKLRVEWDELSAAQKAFEDSAPDPYALSVYERYRQTKATFRHRIATVSAQMLDHAE